jgi:hypothetical protein
MTKYCEIIINCGESSSHMSRIGGIKVIASSTVDCGFKPCSGQTKDYKIGICCFYAKHTVIAKTQATFDEMRTMSTLYQNNRLSWIFIVQAH